MRIHSSWSSHEVRFRVLRVKERERKNVFLSTSIQLYSSLPFFFPFSHFSRPSRLSSDSFATICFFISSCRLTNFPHSFWYFCRMISLPPLRPVCDNVNQPTINLHNLFLRLFSSHNLLHFFFYSFPLPQYNYGTKYCVMNFKDTSRNLFSLIFFFH